MDHRTKEQAKRNPTAAKIYPRPTFSFAKKVSCLFCLSGLLGWFIGFRAQPFLSQFGGIHVPILFVLLALLLNLVLERLWRIWLRQAWGPETSGLILQGQITLGMSPAQVEEAWGKPMKKEMPLLSQKETTLKYLYKGMKHQHQQLWFKNDRLIRVDP